jgi:hypothetical protein
MTAPQARLSPADVLPRHQLCLAGPAINKGPPFLLLVTDYRFEGEEDELNLATPAATRLFPPAGG